MAVWVSCVWILTLYKTINVFNVETPALCIFDGIYIFIKETAKRVNALMQFRERERIQSSTINTHCSLKNVSDWQFVHCTFQNYIHSYWNHYYVIKPYLFTLMSLCYIPVKALFASYCQLSLAILHTTSSVVYLIVSDWWSKYEIAAFWLFL